MEVPCAEEKMALPSQTSRSVVAKRSCSGADSSSVFYRMWVWILSWWVATFVCLGKALYHNSFSPPRSSNGYRREVGSNLRWTGILSGGNILCCLMPTKLHINTGLMSHIFWLGTDFFGLVWWLECHLCDLPVEYFSQNSGKYWVYSA